jgi:hypothetical protein
MKLNSDTQWTILTTTPQLYTQYVHGKCSLYTDTVCALAVLDASVPRQLLEKWHLNGLKHYQSEFLSHRLISLCHFRTEGQEKKAN